MEKMVALANGVHSDLVALPNDRARYDLVKQIIDSAEMVFAVWADRFAQDGVGHMLVKGQAIARQAVADNKTATAQSRLRHCCTSLANGIAGTDLFGGGSASAGLRSRASSQRDMPQPNAPGKCRRSTKQEYLIQTRPSR